MAKVSGGSVVVWAGATKLKTLAMTGAGLTLVAAGATLTYWSINDILANEETARENEARIANWNTVLQSGKMSGERGAENMLKNSRKTICSTYGFQEKGKDNLTSCESEFIRRVGAAYSFGRAMAMDATLYGGVPRNDYNKVFDMMYGPRLLAAMDYFEQCLREQVCCPAE